MVHALDISQVALERVKPIVEKVWTPQELKDMPSGYFDLILSHLVTQHMSKHDLMRQIQYAIRGLVRGGIFAMQFASWLDSVSREETDQLMKVGGVCYTLDQMNEIVEECGGQVRYSNQIATFPGHKSCWYVIHMSNVQSNLPKEK